MADSKTIRTENTLRCVPYCHIGNQLSLIQKPSDNQPLSEPMLTKGRLMTPGAPFINMD